MKDVWGLRFCRDTPRAFKVDIPPSSFLVAAKADTGCSLRHFDVRWRHCASDCELTAAVANDEPKQVRAGARAAVECVKLVGLGHKATFDTSEGHVRDVLKAGVERRSACAQRSICDNPPPMGPWEPSAPNFFDLLAARFAACFLYSSIDF